MKPFTAAFTKLSEAGLRPTRQRMALAQLLFDGVDKHVSAENLYERALETRHKMSLATVYNTLHQFCAAGLMQEVIIDGQRRYFDTNTAPHHHFFREDTGELLDIPPNALPQLPVPDLPQGTKLSRVDIVFRLRDDTSASGEDPLSGAKQP